MTQERAASIPLITIDPYFSIYSPADRLYDADTEHWSRLPQKMYGFLNIDGSDYCFLGRKGDHRIITQTGLTITATQTAYTFENEWAKLTLKLTSPLLLDEPLLVSRPCVYIDFEVEKKKEVPMALRFEMSSDLVRNTKGKVIGRSAEAAMADGERMFYVSMGKADQRPLGHSGDLITIDWGEAYLASNQSEVAFELVKNGRDISGIRAVCSLPKKENRISIVAAYDDQLSINYFGTWKKAYWTETYATIIDALAASLIDRAETMEKAARMDKKIEALARSADGEDYVFLCNISYRQSISAHKLITDDEGRFIFLSKENNSNGCIGTVDVSYPSIPLYLLFNTEYVKGMMRPIFKFSDLPVWNFDFAPHDVGRYPYATGQVYGLNPNEDGYDSDNGCIYPNYYSYPEGSDVYDLRYQMPVEECGNMLIMTAVVCKMDGNSDFAKPHEAVLKQWVSYLLKYGSDPGEQLCTDDFAGHLSHNVNLSAKAIMGIEAYAELCKLSGREEEYKEYHEKAASMARSWEERSFAGDHYKLGFDNEASWSLKYNTVWDRYFGSNLFSRKMYETELAYYLQKNNDYGVPLDSRRSYTKSDWIAWSAALTDDRRVRETLLEPIARYQRESKTRVAFSDWYDTETGDYCHFIARSVQGGIFMPIFIDETCTPYLK